MDCNKFELRNNLLQLINQLINEKHYDGIELLLQDKRNLDTIKYNTAYFIELCKIYLTDECLEKDSNLYFTCENFLKSIAKNSLITECLLELLEIIDSTESDNVFTTTLKALQILLLREESDRKSLEWGLNEVSSFISKLKYPSFLVTGYDEQQKSLLEQNEDIHKILISYITVTLFYDPILIKEIKICFQTKHFKDTTKNKLNVLSSFLFELLGQPLDFYRNFCPLTPSKAIFNQLYWNTNLYVTVGRSYYNGFNFQIQKKYSTSLNDPTIDDFRAREEAKEKEYQKQQAEKDNIKSEEEDKAKEEKLKTVRLKILEASLPFVEEYGWTIDTLVHGAEKAGLPGVAHGLFPNGSIELILYFYSNCNSKLVEYLKEQTKNGEVLPKESTEFLVKAARYRLELLIPYKRHWPQALAKMALPQNVPKSLAQILTMIDDICYFAGDRSVDFGWYARRVGMSTIYKLTELYMLQDTSENHNSTWEFLKNRVDEAQLVELVFGQSGEPSQRTKNKLHATFETARNVLGLNYDRRI